MILEDPTIFCHHAVLASVSEGTPIPSHFTKTDICIGAMDNSDHADNSSLSGTHIYPMMGMFHYCKVLLRCSGRLLIGTGLDDGLVEAEVFGKKSCPIGFSWLSLCKSNERSVNH